MFGEDTSKLPIETRVALLERMYTILHTDFRELRTTIVTTAISVVGFLMLSMLGIIVYFAQQKDAAITEIKTALEQSFIKQKVDHDK